MNIFFHSAVIARIISNYSLKFFFYLGYVDRLQRIWLIFQFIFDQKYLNGIQKLGHKV